MLRLRALVLLALLPLWASGCRISGGALTPLAEGQFDARVQLATPQGDPVERAIALAEAEWSLERPERAAEAMRLALHRAQAAWWMARIEGDAEATRAARRTLDRTAREARRWARRTDDPRLMTLAVLASPHPRRHRRALRRAVARLYWAPADIDPDRLMELLGNDAAARRQVARWVDLPQWQHAGVQDDEGDPEAADLSLAALHHAVDTRAPHPELRARAATVYAADPADLDASLLRLGLDEVGAGVLTDDPVLVDDLLGRSVPTRPMLARLWLRRRHDPRSVAIPLALARTMLADGLVGDAHALLEDLVVPPDQPIAHRPYDQLVAMIAAHRGDVAAFEHWRIQAEVRSVWLDHWLRDFDDEGWDPRLRAAGRRALRRRARSQVPLIEGFDRWAARLDPEISEADRQRVRDMEWQGARGGSRAREEICRHHGLDARGCLDAEDLEMLLLAGRSRHFHPSLLRNTQALDTAQLQVLAPVLDHYASTVLAASPEFLRARVQQWLATGEYGEARALLETQGPLVPSTTRTWAWLALGDLESGGADYDALGRWLPGFHDEPPLGEVPIEAPESSRQLDRYIYGMELAQGGRHAAALEILLPLVDALPDEVMADALAQAALAAHRTGDAERRDALRVRLHAVDPHGSTYALLQATLSGGAGRVEEARRFVAHALRWHPGDTMLQDRMVSLLAQDPPPAEADALAYVAHGTSQSELAPLRRQIRLGAVTSLAQLRPIHAGLKGDAEAAWSIDPAALAEFPSVADQAVRWGVEQLTLAPDLAEALRWGEATLARLEAEPPRSEWARDQALWLAVLMGRTDTGLAAVRQDDPTAWIRPRGDDTTVLLLRARQAGEIDDALAWDLWRWAYGTDAEAAARVDALLQAPPRGTLLQAYACTEMTANEQIGLALEVCGQAFEDQPETWAVVVALSYLALNDPEADRGEATATRIFEQSPKAPSFHEQPALARGDNTALAWHQNHATWLGKREEHEAAADAWWQAYALGLNDDAGLQHGYAQLRTRGPLMRSLQVLREGGDGRRLDLRRGMLALAGVEPAATRAYAESGRVRVPAEPGALDRSELMLPDRLRHLADWAEADLEDGSLAPEAMAEAVDLVLSPELPRAQALHREYPNASLATLALLLGHQEVRDEPPMGPLAETLLEQHPDDPLAVAMLLPRLVAAEQDERARALYRRAWGMHPGDAMLLYADAPESITGPRDGVPGWVRDPERFDQRLAEVTQAQVLGLLPERHASDERAAEIFVPHGFSPVESRPLRFIDGHGARLMVLMSPRASRCQGIDCARELLDGVAGQGRTKQWMRPTTLAGLPATWALFTNAEEVLLAWVLPAGGRVITVVAAATVDRFDALRPTLVMLRDGVRPLDGVLPSFPAESLRAAGPTLRDTWRLRARLEQAQDPGGSDCPVGQTLAALPHAHQRAELLVDLWLASPEPGARRRLLACTESHAPAARRLALVSLLDEDPEAHEFGRRAVPRHATRVVADVRTILSAPLTPPVADPDYLRRTDLPGHGLVEVLGVLPEAHARPLVDRLRTSADARDRTLAWAALRLRPSLASDAAIDEALAGEARLVGSAAFLLSDRGEPGDAERLRAYLDALPPAADRDAQTALRSVAVALATVLDPRDEDRLRRAADLVADGDDPERAEDLRDGLRQVARDHARARALMADPALVPGDDDERALRWRDELRRRVLPIRDEADLRDHTLAQLLPGRDWTFARLAAPGLFTSTVADVAERLTTGNEAVDQRLGDMTTQMLRQGGFEMLSGGGGLDPSRPIECAAPADDNGWLCTARVTDRDALLRGLGQRASGDDAGVALPLSIATTAGIVPVALSLLPALLHPFIYDEDDEDDEDEEHNVIDATERVRMTIEMGEMTLARYSIVEARTRRIGIDSERYLLVGDRLWVFSTRSTMERALRVHEGPALADDPEFQRLTAGWTDGAALQAVSLGRAWPVAEGGGAMEVVLDEGGLDFRYAGAFESEEGVGDIGPALAQLPEGATTIFAHGLGEMTAFDEPLTAEGSDATRVPPMPVLARAPGVAFGWYPSDGDRLWRRWLAVTPMSAELRGALRRAKTPAGRAKSRRYGGLCYRERDGYLLVGDCTLVDQVVAGPPPPPVSRDRLRVAHATFDGALAAQRIVGLGGFDLEQQAMVRAVAPLLGIVTDMGVRADWSPAQRTAVLEGHVGLQLRAAGDRTRVIDDWLAASEGKNAASLPRRLRSEELEGPLRYRVRVPDAEAFVRDSIADSPRVNAEIEDDTHVWLTVSAVPAEPEPVPLTDRERKTFTRRTNTLRSDDPRIVKIAGRLAPEGTPAPAAAEAIAAWVHERISYEVTPRSLDATEILELSRGDCTEYAQLTVTLLRAAGVPARVRDGMAAGGGELVAHAWVGYHDGTRWREIDPTWGRTTASSGHLEMSVLDALALISLGKFEVLAVEAVAAP